MGFDELMQRSDAEIAFTGLGPHDVFNIRHLPSYYIGTVIYSTDAPPFVNGDGNEYKYAPDYTIFPRGLILLSGQVGKPKRKRRNKRR